VSRQKFTARLEASTVGTGGHWVVVPDAVMSELTDKARAEVKATFNGVPYRGSVVKYSGAYVLGVTKAIMTQAGLSTGDTVQVSIEPDTEKRTVTIPDDLADALKANPKLQSTWDALSYTRRKEKAQSLTEAKRPETRSRRLDAILRDLAS
jgi:Bacteriocin-protection, YdeI or OmpD-Associated/Domain of unknown function (DUF1905)